MKLKRWHRTGMAILGVSVLATVCIFVHLVVARDMIEKKLPSKNQTSYIFSASKDEIKRCIQKSFESESYRGMSLAFRDDDDPFAKKVLNLPGNEDDAYLYTFHEPIGRSAVYFINEEPLEYIASFQVHLSSVDTHETKVDIITHGPEVIAGKKFALGPCGLGKANIYVAVSSTTIEEYEVLLKIGNGLGVRNMPNLIMPR